MRNNQFDLSKRGAMTRAGQNIEGHVSSTAGRVLWNKIVCLFVSQGQKNIEDYFCLKTRPEWFWGMEDMGMSVDQSQTTSRGVTWPPSTSGVKKNIKNYFCLKNRFQWFSEVCDAFTSVDQAQSPCREFMLGIFTFGLEKTWRTDLSDSCSSEEKCR